MTTQRVLWPAGIGVVDEDLQRAADVASQAGDHVLEELAFPGGADGSSYVKRLRPLLDELRPAPDPLGGSPVYAMKSPRILAVEAAYYDGVTIGRVGVLPCAVDIVGPSAVQAAQAVALSGKVTAMLTAPVHASTTAGRVDTVYLSVRFNSPGGAAVLRRMKNTTTGVVTTETVNVYADVEVSVAVAAGTEASSTPGALPADAGGTYNVAVCTVALPAGYVSGGVLFDMSGSFIRQVWSRAALRRQAVEVVRPGDMAFTTNCDAGPAGNLNTLLGQSQRLRGGDRIRAVFRHTGAGALCVLDNTLWWCMREVRVSVLRSAAHVGVSPFGVYVPPSLAVLGGASMAEDSGWVHSGQLNTVTGGGAPVGQFFSTSGPPVMHFFARGSDGALVVTIADAPLDAAGDFYTVIAECLDQNVE